MGRILLIIIFFSLSRVVWGSSCCGQSPTSFTVLSLEQRLNLTSSYSFVESQGRIFNSGEFYAWDDKDREVQSLQLGLASSIASRHQVFTNISLLQGHYRDSFESGSARHLSDTQLGYNFELLPEYSFSYWKPIVYISAIANVPTGKSIYDSSVLSEGADVTGHNQWGVGMGLTLRKIYFPLTITLQVKSLKILSKEFLGLRISDFYDSSLALLFNYVTSFQALAINLGITANQLTPRKLSTTQTSSGVMQSTSVLLGLQKTFGSSWSGGISYSNQSLLGRAKNTLLNKTYSFNLSYNYF